MADLLLLDGESIKPAQALAAGLPGCRVRVFDPTLVDKARQAGFAEVEFQASQGLTPFDELCRWAHGQAAAVGARLQAEMAALVPGIDVVGWQHLNLYYQFSALKSFNELWGETAEDLVRDAAGATLHIPVNDNPGHYYWPSFVPGLLLLQRLRGIGAEFRAYNVAPRPDPSQRLLSLAALKLTGDEVLTHLPTCFYDRDYLAGEIAASRHAAVNLPARQWNIDLPAAQSATLADLSEVIQVLPAAQRERLEAMRARAHAVLDQAFQPWLPSAAYRERQAAASAALLHSQLVLHALLEHHLGAQKPRRVLMSEHDAGFHGPLLAWAQGHGIPTLLVPHAKTMWDIEFPWRGFTTFTHPLQAESLVDAHGRHVPHQPLALPEALRGDTGVPAPLRRIGLLLNGLVLGGVFVTPYGPYAEGIARIARWCRQRGIQLEVRSRPGQVMTDLLAQTAGPSATEVEAPMAGSLADFVARTSLCLMYDAPTNAAADFLRAGVPILNPVVDVLSRAERMTCSDQIVPREDVGATLDRLDHFIGDPQRLQLFRIRQFARYVALFEGARPLRQWL